MVLLASEDVLVVTADLGGHPAVQELQLVLPADEPVGEGGLAGEIVDTNSGQNHGAARHTELLGWRHLLWLLVQGQQREEILLAPDLQGDGMLELSWSHHCFIFYNYLAGRREVGSHVAL